jgi:hypothetical protein
MLTSLHDKCLHGCGIEDTRSPTLRVYIVRSTPEILVSSNCMAWSDQTQAVISKHVYRSTKHILHVCLVAVPQFSSPPASWVFTLRYHQDLFKGLEITDQVICSYQTSHRIVENRLETEMFFGRCHTRWHHHMPSYSPPSGQLRCMHHHVFPVHSESSINFPFVL